MVRRIQSGAPMLFAVIMLTAWLSYAEDQYLFTSFRGNGESGLHLLLSTNGYQWSTVNQDRSMLTPQIGGKLMRDPCLRQGPDGRFHLVWTTGWTVGQGKVIGYANSTDLIHWSEQKGINLMDHEPQTRNLWAPELFYDEAKAQWLIFWSSTIPGRFPQTDGSGDDGYNHRIYGTVTKDFSTFAPSRIFFDPGYNVIDATLFKGTDRFYLVFKDERKNPLAKYLKLATAPSAEGPFSSISSPFTTNWVEGPSAIRINHQYLVYFDHYASPHYYGAVRSQDLEHWEDCSREMSFPRDHRHGTVLRISAELASRLRAYSSAN
jgi:hypothetical protein